MDITWILIGVTLHFFIFILGVIYLAKVIKKHGKDNFFDL